MAAGQIGPKVDYGLQRCEQVITYLEKGAMFPLCSSCPRVRLQRGPADVHTDLVSSSLLSLPDVGTNHTPQIS